MEGRRILDTAGSSRGGFALSFLSVPLQSMRAPRLLHCVAAFLFLCSLSVFAAQADSSGQATLQQAERFASQHRWQEIADLLGGVKSRSADEDFYYATALAHLGRLGAAERAFAAGQKLAPSDARFPTELAGIAFTQKRYARAAHLLRRTIALSPHDVYANNFLGTVYYLEGNVEAALKYWNRVGKPNVAQIREEPVPSISPALLDRAFAFSPAAVLQWPQFLATNTRIGGLGIFPEHQLDLNARDDGKFDVVFRSQELNGFGSTKLEALLLLFQGLPFSSVTPEYDNFHREAINFDSMYRWDAQKRRIWVQLSSPFEGSAKYRTYTGTDLRDENWVIRNSFTGTAPALASLNLRTERADFDLASFASGRWNWSAGAEISHRNFRDVIPGSVLTPALLASGYQLKQLAAVNANLLRLPERRFVLDAGISAQSGRLWARSQESFEKLQGSAGWHWFPKARGDDYETQNQIHAGRTFGEVPFDELFMLGLERDNNLPMRAHIGTRDGRKGSAPLGRDYFLSNWEMDKDIYGNGIISATVGPLLDIGKISDPNAALGSHEWLFDAGAQAKLRVLGRGVEVSYGRDLRTGNNAFYVTVLRARGPEHE